MPIPHWEREIKRFDRNLRRRMKKIRDHEITGLPVDQFIDLNKYYYNYKKLYSELDIEDIENIDNLIEDY